MSQEPSPKEAVGAQGSDPGALGPFVLALREALLGLPSSGLPADAAELRAELSRLQALAKRLEAHEADLEAAKQRLLGPWQELLTEALPKLRARVDAGGLQNVFEFQALLEDIRRRLAAPPAATLPEGLQAQEVTRLQAEVVRLLEARRRSESESPASKARLADLEAQVQAAQEQLQRQARELAEARALKDEAMRDAEQARKIAAELEWQRAYRDAAAQSIESRQFQEQFQQLRERIKQLEGEVDTARQAALTAAGEIGLLRDELSRGGRKVSELETERRRLHDSEETARAAAGRLQALAEAAQRDLEAVKDRDSVLQRQLSELHEHLAAAQAQAEHDRTARLEQTEAVRRLEEQVSTLSRLRAELEPKLTQAIHDATERAVELERVRARLGVVEESNAERTAQLELASRKAAEEAATAKRLAEALEQVERAHRALDAHARAESDGSRVKLERAESERRRAAEALQEALDRIGRLEEEAGYARHAEQSSIDRAVEAETRARQLEAIRRRLEGELVRAREELSDLKSRADQLDRAEHAAHEALAASEAAERESVRLTKTLSGEVEALQERLAAAEQRLSEANAELDDTLAKQGKSAGGRQALELETERLRVDLVRAQASLAQERRERTALEDELAQARARLVTEAKLAREQAEAPAPARAEPAPDETPERPAPPAEAPKAPPSGLDGLDAALRTLLGILEAALSVVRAATDASGSAKPVLQNVHGELSVVQDQLRALVEFFRAPPPPAPRVVAPIVDAVVLGWSPALRARRIEVSKDIRADLPPCAIGPERLTLVVHQLLKNAIEVMPDGGRLEIVLDQDGDDVRLTLRDDGHGLPADVLDDPSRPFRRSLPGHMGIGLALAYRVARTAGGELRLSNLRDGGAEVQLLLPRHVPKR
ncbi:MAG: hypothetical protein HY553_10725 [Elusimicrobia bacterium]|nr:hypothetical protein [Elusimicrobiota bacterium]